MRAGCTRCIANFPGRPLDSVRGENETFGVIANSNGRRMGRYKDYREPKRRGYDDDYSPQDRVAEKAASFDNIISVSSRSRASPAAADRV